jgi:hypothetical protein
VLAVAIESAVPPTRLGVARRSYIYTSIAHTFRRHTAARRMAGSLSSIRGQHNTMPETTVKRYTWIIAAVAGVAAVIVGLSQGQGILVLNWARILCTSCIGLSD